MTHCWLGQCYIYAREYDKAIEHGLKAYELNTQYGLQYLVLAKAYIWKGEYEKAFESYKLGRKYIGDDGYYENLPPTYKSGPGCL